jgi:hypothetical protein
VIETAQLIKQIAATGIDITHIRRTNDLAIKLAL